MAGTGTSPRLAFAHVLRGFAALLVVLWHFLEARVAGLLSTAGRGAAPTAETLTAAEPTAAAATEPAVPLAATLAELFDLGQIGVGIFFLISGLVIPYVFQRQGRLGFLTSRFFRIWPTYAAGFTVSLVVLFVASSLMGKAISYSSTDILAHYSMFRDLGGFPNIDRVVWTLEIELRFYLFCALLAPLLRAHDAGRLIAAGLLLAIVSIAIGEISVSALAADAAWTNLAPALGGTGQFIIFMMIGVLFHLKLVGAVTALRAATFGAVFFMLFLLLAARGPDGPLPALAAYGTGLAVFTLAFVFRTGFVETGPLGRVGTISYSLYVIHPLLGGWIVFALTKAGFPVAITFAVGFAAVIVGALALHVLVEKPSQAFGRLLAGRIGGTLAPHANVARAVF
jgi:peptidoglycan/LPS O-acetylase OafA/YrhL